MKRKLPTLLILLVMALFGAMHWMDMAYYTDLRSGLPLQGAAWMRYAALLLPLAMMLLGLRTIGPMGASVLRVRSRPLAGVFAAAALVGMVLGVCSLLSLLWGFSILRFVLGILYLWYGIWMFLVALQLLVQAAPSPTQSAIWGVVAALPFCVLAVARITLTPVSLHRPGPSFISFSALAVLLWMGLLTRALYVSLPQNRVRRLYFAGLTVFLLATCLEVPTALYRLMFQPGGASALALLESLNVGMVGLCAGCVSAAIAGRSDEADDLARLRPTGDPL